MIKDTSKAAFDALDKETLDDRVYRALRVGLQPGHPGGREQYRLHTRREVARYMNEQASTISGAVNRLIKAGVVVVDFEPTKCWVTGRMVEHISCKEDA